MSQTHNSKNCNGFILKTNYIPEELLVQILSYVDYRQLILCHLVCKQWNELIKKNVWRKKAELICGQALFFDDTTPWNLYYLICSKNPFTRNLLTSNDVKIIYDNEDYFKNIQLNDKDNNSLINILPFPKDQLFKGNINCINVLHDSYVSVKRKFVIDLIKEGFSDYLLDNLQPIIKVSAWYGASQEAEKAEYECSVKLLNGDDDCNRVMKVYYFNKKLTSIDKRGKWFKFTHLFKHYGPGLRVIKFYDGGHNNIIIAGASVVMTVPPK